MKWSRKCETSLEVDGLPCLIYWQPLGHATSTVCWTWRSWRVTFVLCLWVAAHWRLLLGLDFHYMNSPAEVQKAVLRRQLRQAVSLAKPLTIHTREADRDIEIILKEEVPRSHKVGPFCTHPLAT